MSQTASIFYSDTDKDYECWCPSCGSIYGVWDEDDIVVLNKEKMFMLNVENAVNHSI